jgi:hypothetical protein
MFNNLFFVKVFKHNKFLFILFLGFTLGSLFFNYKTVETTPFFVWGMYSAKETVPQSHKIIVVKYNNSKMLCMPHTYQEPMSMMVYFTLNYYTDILQNNNKDYLQRNLESNYYIKYPFIKKFGAKLYTNPNEVANYLPWLKKYIASIVNEPVTNFDVYQCQVKYNVQQHVELLNAKKLYHY